MAGRARQRGKCCQFSGAAAELEPGSHETRAGVEGMMNHPGGNWRWIRDEWRWFGWIGRWVKFSGCMLRPEADPCLTALAPLAAKFGRDRPSGRGGAGARGGRGGRGGANAARSNGGSYLGGDKPRRENGGGRNFDRHSQTAHKDSDKATAAGWGADEGKTELKAEVEGEADAKADEAAAATEAAAPVEEEDNSQTYEEFLAAKAAANLKIGGDLPEARKANEGVDESQWANQTLRTKKADEEEESLFAIKTKAAKAKKERAAKQTIEANFSFAAPSRPERDGERPARGRGGARGGGRGRGARGGPRGGAAGAPRGASRAQVQAPALEDAAAFPSLA